VSISEKEAALEWMKSIQIQELEEWEQQRELELQRAWEDKWNDVTDVR